MPCYVDYPLRLTVTPHWDTIYQIYTLRVQDKHIYFYEINLFHAFPCVQGVPVPIRIVVERRVSAFCHSL
jgi:hypothetical protein